VRNRRSLVPVNMSVSTSPFDSATTKQMDMYVNYELKGLPSGTYFTNGSVQCQSFHTVGELKRRIHRDLSGINTETLYHLGLSDDSDPSALRLSFEGRSLDDSQTLAFYHIENSSTVEIGAPKDVKTFVLDLIVFTIYILLNIAINLYNKWMFSVLKFEVPLANLAIHQMAGFVVLGTVAIFSSFCKMQCCSKCGINGLLTFTKKDDCRTWGVIVAIGFTGAFNFGMTSYSLMLLSQADLQIIRATIPLFTAVSFAILEGRKFSPLAIILLFVTVTGAVIVVAFHSQKWKLDTLGLVLAIASNFMAAAQMSMLALARNSKTFGNRSLSSFETVFYSSIPLGVTVLPFSLGLMEGKKFATFADSHSVGVLLLALAGGTALAVTYNLVHTEFIQRTTSVFVAVAGNFKIVLLIGLSEVLVQTTNLPPMSIVGIAIVCLAFFGSFAEREIQKRPWILRAFRESREGCNPCCKCLFKKFGCPTGQKGCCDPDRHGATKSEKKPLLHES